MPRQAPFAVIGLLGLLGGSACTKPSAPTPFAQTPKVLVGAVFDAAEAPVADASDRLDAAVASALSERGLRLVPVDDAALIAAFGDSRSSEVRLTRLAAAGDGELLVLVELAPSFFAQVAGRYRWSVPVTIQVAWRGAPEKALVRKHELPANLLYYHERESAAVDEVSPLVARHVASAVEAFLARESG